MKTCAWRWNYVKDNIEQIEIERGKLSPGHSGPSLPYTLPAAIWDAMKAYNQALRDSKFPEVSKDWFGFAKFARNVLVHFSKGHIRRQYEAGNIQPALADYLDSKDLFCEFLDKEFPEFPDAIFNWLGSL